MLAEEINEKKPCVFARPHRPHLFLRTQKRCLEEKQENKKRTTREKKHNGTTNIYGEAPMATRARKQERHRLDDYCTHVGKVDKQPNGTRWCHKASPPKRLAPARRGDPSR